MIANCTCRACGLRFEVGWSDEPPGDGYGATSRLVCTKCGTEHAVEIALRDRGPERIHYYDVLLVEVKPSRREDAALVLVSRFDMTHAEAVAAFESLPLTIARGADEILATEMRDLFSMVGVVEMTETASGPNPLHGALRRDRFLSGKRPRFDEKRDMTEIGPLGPRHGAHGEFDLEAQACAACGMRGSLEGNPWEIDDRCPSCGKHAVVRLETDHVEDF